MILIILSLLCVIFACPPLIGAILTIILRLAFYFFGRYWLLSNGGQTKPLLDQDDESFPFLFMSIRNGMKVNWKGLLLPIPLISYSNKEKLRFRSIYPFIHFPLPYQGTKAFIFINGLHINSISSIFEVAFHSPFNLRVGGICLSFRIDITNQNGSIISSTSFDLEIGALNASIYVLNLFYFTVITPIVHQIHKIFKIGGIEQKMYQTDDKAKMRDTKVNDLLKALPHLLNNINIEKFAVSIEAEQQLIKNNNIDFLSPTKNSNAVHGFRGNVNLSFHKMSCQMIIPESYSNPRSIPNGKSLIQQNKIDFDNNNFTKITESLLNIKFYMDRLLIQAESDLKPNENTNSRNGIRMVARSNSISSPSSNSPILLLPSLLADITFSSEISTPTFLLSNTHPLFQTNEEKMRTISVHIDAHDARISHGNAKSSGDSLQVSCGVQELVNVTTSIQSYKIMLLRLLDLCDMNENHRNIKQIIDESIQEHKSRDGNIQTQVKQQQASAKLDTLIGKKKNQSAFLFDRLSVEMGFMISIYDNIDDLSDNPERKPFDEFYSARDLMVDQNSEVLSKTNSSCLYSILEMCANGINATLTMNKDLNEKDCKMDHLVIADIPIHEIYLTFYDYETDETDSIDLIHIKNPILKCMIKKKDHEEVIDIHFDVHNVMCMVDVHKMETLKKIAHNFKNHVFHMDQKENETKKRPTASKNQFKTNRSVIVKSSKFTFKSVDLFLINVLDKKNDSSSLIITPPASSIMLHLQFLGSSISKFLHNFTIPQQHEERIHVNKLVISLCMTLSREVLIAIKTPSLRPNLGNKTFTTSFFANVQDINISWIKSQNRHNVKTTNQCISTGKILLYEYRYCYIAMNRNSLRSLTSFLEMEFGNESHHQLFQPCIVSDGFEASFSPSVDQVYSSERNILVYPTEIIWSPFFHLSIMATMKSISSILDGLIKQVNDNNLHDERFSSQPQGNVQKSKKLSSCRVVTKFDNILVSVSIGASSNVDISTDSIELDMGLNYPGLGSKSNVSVLFESSQFTMNKFQPPFLVVDKIIFKDTFIIAPTKDVTSYQAKVRQCENYSKFDDRIQSNEDGCPLMEEINLHFGNLNVNLVPDLHFGRVLDDILLTPKVLDEVSHICGYVKQKKRKIYQLMSISSTIVSLDMSCLEYGTPSIHSGAEIPISVKLDEVKSSKSDKYSPMNDALVSIFRIVADGIDVKIIRNMPPSATHHYLAELDEDPNNEIGYGPEVKGGFMTMKISHLVAILDPLNLVTPLVVIDHLKWRGLLFLTEVSPETPHLIPSHQFYVPLSCSHKTCRQNFFSKNLNETKTICNYHIQTQSRGIPTKFYIDGVIKTKKMHITFGPQIQGSLPLLMSIIKRVLPPPPEYESSMSIPLAWWDNLRFVIHGKVTLLSESILFRWLLDTVDNSEWSILVRCKDFDLSYVLSDLKLCLKDLYISLPSEPYVINLKRRKSVRLQKSPTIVCCSHDRQPVLFIPSFELGLAFEWSVASSDVFSPMAHHSPYMVTHTAAIPSEEALPLKKSSDKFYYFRSDGVALKLKVVMTGSYEFSNWIVMRIEMLPWITHQYVNKNSPILQNSNEIVDPDDPGPLPKIIRLLMNFEAQETKVALWHGALETAGLSIKVPAIKFNYLASRKNSKIEKFTHISTRIEIDGDTQGALLDVMNPDAINPDEQKIEKRDKALKQEKDFYKAKTVEEVKSSFDNNFIQNLTSFERIKLFDSACGAFGAMKNEFDLNIRNRNRNHKMNDQSKSDGDHRNYFQMLEKWMHELSQVDYVVQATKIIIVDSHTPLEESLAIKDIFHFQSKEKMQSWAIFVSGMKLLWTLEIRDVLFKVIGDHLLETINFMVVQLKGDAPVVDTDDMNDDEKGLEIQPAYQFGDDADKMSSNMESGINENKSSLMYLLQRGKSSSRVKFTQERDASSGSQYQLNHDDTSAEIRMSSLPIVNIYLLNPQIQLHSQSTGGSIILAMKGAYVEGRSFIKLYVDNQSSSDVSKDKMLRKLEFKYALDSVRGFSVSTNVDINVGLQWLDLVTEDDLNEKKSRHTRTDTISNLAFILDQNLIEESNQTSNHCPSEFFVPNLFRQILEPFNFRARQKFFLPPNNLSENEIINYITRHLYIELNGPATDNLEIQIDKLSFVLDGNQFSTTMDLLRNVLLAPLPSQIAKKKTNAPEEDDNAMKTKKKHLSLWHDEAEQIKELISTFKNSNSDVINNKTNRNTLRAALRNLGSKIEARNSEKGNETVRCITWNLFKAKWKIRGESYIDDVEIRFTELHGRHEFSSIGGLVSTFELEDLGAINSKPSPDSINFDDPTAVVTTVLGDDRSPCQRCGKIFSQLDNEIGSCVFHADPYGVPGVFQMNSKSGRMQWSCCDSTDRNAKGCHSRPHTGIERALMIQVEAHPKVMDKITLYKHFEINFFPSVNHTLNIQITKSIAELVMDYFVGVKNIDEDALSTTDSHRSDITTSTDGGMTNNRSDLRRYDTLMSSEITLDSNSEKKKNLLLGQTNRLRSSQTKTEKISQSLSSKVSKHMQEEGDLKKSNKAKEDSEIFFIKHWRIGHVNFELSFAGFPVFDTSNFFIAVNAFPKFYKIGHVPYLSQKYLTYLIQEVILSATSSGFKKIFKEDALHHQAGDDNTSTNVNDFAKLNSAERKSEKVNLLLGTPRKNRRSK